MPILPLIEAPTIVRGFLLCYEVICVFTGIVEEIGTVQGVSKGQQAMQLAIDANVVLSDVKLGDSIAVNGVCLTVTNFSASHFTADVMPETFRASNLHQLKASDRVNLERAMAANGRFGGHMVSGHIDDVGIIEKIRPESNAVKVSIQIPTELAEQCIKKGSITIDGTSLTIFDVTKTNITVSLIPHTYKESVIGQKKVGALVNVETDMISKYVQHHLRGKSSTLTMDFLQKNGF